MKAEKLVCLCLCLIGVILMISGIAVAQFKQTTITDYWLWKETRIDYPLRECGVMLVLIGSSSLLIGLFGYLAVSFFEMLEKVREERRRNEDK
jgi:hypothetical protein